MPRVAPAGWVALAIALAGAGLVVSFFLQESPRTPHLVLGIVLVAIAMLTSGVHLLARNAGSMREET